MTHQPSQDQDLLSAAKAMVRKLIVEFSFCDHQHEIRQLLDAITKAEDEGVRAAFAAAEKLPPLPLADDPDDAVMALAAAARTSRKGPEGNAFVLQHIIRVINSYRVALAPKPTGTEATPGVGAVPTGWKNEHDNGKPSSS